MLSGLLGLLEVVFFLVAVTAAPAGTLVGLVGSIVVVADKATGLDLGGSSACRSAWLSVVEIGRAGRQSFLER